MAEKKTKPSRGATVRTATANMRGHGSRHMGGFVDFLREQGVVGLAIGFVLGAAAATLVRSLIENVVMPPVGILLGSADGLKGLQASLGMHYGEEVVVRYGQFLSDMVNFAVLALIVYLVVRVLKFDRADKKKD